MAMTFLADDGTVRLPPSIQKKLGIKKGDRIELLPFDKGQVLMVAKNQSLSSLKGILPKPDLDCNVAELMEMALERGVKANK